MKRLIVLVVVVACSTHRVPSVTDVATTQASAKEPSPSTCPVLRDRDLARGTSVPPFFLAAPVFEYPKELGETTSPDSVIVAFVVDRDGTVPECSVTIKTMSDPGLAPFVRPAVASMRFAPARNRGGAAAPSRLQLTLAFLPKAEAEKRRARRLVFSVPYQEPPALIAGGAAPKYPTELIPQQLSGSVIVSVLVTAAGRIDPASVEIVSSDHPLFTKAVRDVLPELRFQPGKLGSDSTRVATRIQLPFQFRAP